MPDEINPDERAKLIKLRFQEMFDECWNTKFAEEFDKRVGDLYDASGRPKPQPNAQGTQQFQVPAPQHPSRRKSLFEEALGL